MNSLTYGSSSRDYDHVNTRVGNALNPVSYLQISSKNLRKKQEKHFQNLNIQNIQCMTLLEKSMFLSRMERNLSLRGFAIILCCLFLFVPPVLGEEAVNEMLQPSRSLFSLQNRDDSSLHRARMLENYDGNYFDSDWSLDDSCKFIAITGRLFNQSLYDVIKHRNPELLHEDSDIKIRVADDLFSDWILLNDATSLLQGVPLLRHVGLPHNVIVTVSNHDVISLTIPCTIEVSEEGNPATSSADNRLRLNPGLTDFGCLPTEPVVTLAVRLDVDKNDLGPEKRVKLLEDFGDFMGSSPSFRFDFVTLELENIGKNNAFLSGQGNGGKSMTHFPGVMIYWPIGCGADSVELTGLDLIETSSRDGSLARSIGYDVTQWRAENRKPRSRFREVKRFKRQLDLSKFKSVTIRSPSATRMPNHPGFDPEYNLFPENMADSRGMGNSYLMDEQSSVKPHPGRRRIPNHLILNSPVVGKPTATPLPTPREHPMAVPSSPSIPQSGLPPEEDAGMNDFSVRGSTYFEYRVPEDAFIDREDGNTRSLSLRVIEISSNPADGSWNGDSWMMLDSSSQILYGVPPRLTKKTPKTSYAFLLLAEDRSGKSTTDTFAVHLLARPRPTNHRFSMIFSKYNVTMTTDQLISQVARRLSSALESTWDAVVPPGRYTFLKTDKTDSHLSISWFDNSLGTKTKCNYAGIEQLWYEMTGEEDASAANQRVHPTLQFQNKFEPEFSLKSVKLALSGPCEIPNHVTTTPASTTKFIEPPVVPPRPPATKKTTVKTPKPAPPFPDPPPILISHPPALSNKAKNEITTVQPTTTERGVAKYARPILTNPSFVFKMASSVGKMTSVHVDEFLFIGGPIPKKDGDFNLQLAPWGVGIPPWVGVDSLSWSVIALPTSADIFPLDNYNSTHKVWRSGLAAVDGYGRTSGRVQVQILVAKPPETEENAKVTHLFEINIKNYVVQNFTISDTVRLLDVIKDLYNDANSDNIYVHPIKFGSVIFSWHNQSLASEGHCPYEDIARLATIFFESTSTLRANVYTRFMDAGFNVKAINLRRMNSCINLTTTIPVKSTKPPVVMHADVTIAPKGNDVTVATTSGGGAVLQAGGDGTTSIIIIAVVIACVLFLVLVAVIKYRTSNAAQRRRKNKKRLKTSVATAAVIAPGSPYLLEEHRQNGDATSDQKLHFKPGTPIVFDGETDNGGSGTPLLGNKQTSFNASQPTPSLSCRDEVTSESTPLTDIQTNTHDVDRPPPPPYIRK